MLRLINDLILRPSRGRHSCCLLLMLYGGLLIAIGHQCTAFCAPSAASLLPTIDKSPRFRPWVARNLAATTNGEIPPESDNILATSASRLSHMMLRVPSVDATVAYWKETARGKVTASSTMTNATDNDTEDKLRSAFVKLGNGKTLEDCFALELVKSRQSSYQLGNAVSYIGVSKLVQYTSPKDLIDVFAGDKNDKKKQTDTSAEPNGIPVQSCAAAPGDFFARLCLHTTDMEATADFYTNILGMTVPAVDENEKMLCLRYKTDMAKSSFYGVPTTLVFEPLQQQHLFDKGNCFDHFVIATQASMEKVHTQLGELLNKRQDLQKKCPIFMKPTEMFGQTVIGVIDPNGYKVIVAGKA
jgi:catechol 2,3-dioxygenase-like lactoylglutathione lyase family enzyme